MATSLVDTITAVLARAPEWIRQDLTAKDSGIRTRAEESLAAMIAAALEAGIGPAATPPGQDVSLPDSR